jgi:Na+-translocating ferredoxin:NAD+ oxidoreductase RnfG subunit
MDIQLSYSRLLMLFGVIVIGMVGSSVTTTYGTATNSTTAVSSNLITEVFMDDNFSGNSTLINENIPLLDDPFQDSISSMIISEVENQSSGYVVEICEHKSYSGNCMILEPGEHDITTLDELHDQISSMRYLSPQTLELKNVSSGILINGSN